MNLILTFTESFVNDAYSAAQWYSRTGHDELVEILTVFGTVLLMCWDDLTRRWGATAFIATYNWLMDTFNSCETDFILVPPLSTEEGYITYAVIASDLLGDWQRISEPVRYQFSRLITSVGIAMAVVKELL